MSFNYNNYTKSSRTHELLGASYEEAVNHLGPKPEGRYDLDHICPCAQAKTEEGLIKLQYYTNLQWMEHIENIRKSYYWTPEGEELCKTLLGREWDFELGPKKEFDK